MTGIHPFATFSAIISQLIDTGLPTNPISRIFSILESLFFKAILIFSAWIILFKWPESPIAFPPDNPISLTIFELISLDKTSSTIFTV